MTWITRSLTRVGDFFASIYIRGTSVYSPSRRTFVESDQNLKRIFRRNPVRLPRPTPHFFVHLLQVLLPMTVCGRVVRPRRRPTCPTPHFFLIVCGRCVRPLRRPTLSHALFLCIPVTGVTPPDCVPCPTPHYFVHLLQVLRHLIVYPVPHLISLYALLQVLRHLIVCLEKGSMPHFFVPACNLLAHYTHQELLSTSQRLREIHDEFCNNPALSIRLQC